MFICSSDLFAWTGRFQRGGGRLLLDQEGGGEHPARHVDLAERYHELLRGHVSQSNCTSQIFCCSFSFYFSPRRAAADRFVLRQHTDHCCITTLALLLYLASCIAQSTKCEKYAKK